MIRLISRPFAILAAVACLASTPAFAVENIDLAIFDGIWNFDNAANRLADSSGNGNDLTATSTPAFSGPSAAANGYTPASIFNGGAVFNSPDSGPGVTIPSGVYTGGDFTLSFSARKETGSSRLTFGTMVATSQFQMHIDNEFSAAGLADLQFRATNGSGNSGLDSTDDPFSLDNWNLVTLRYTDAGQQLEVFVQDTETLDPSPQVGTFTGTGLSGVGAIRLFGDGLSGAGGFDSFDGQLDVVVFDNTALSDANLALLSKFVAVGIQVPEPTSIALFSIAALGLGVRRSRRHA